MPFVATQPGAGGAVFGSSTGGHVHPVSPAVQFAAGGVPFPAGHTHMKPWARHPGAGGLAGLNGCPHLTHVPPLSWQPGAGGFAGSVTGHSQVMSEPSPALLHSGRGGASTSNGCGQDWENVLPWALETTILVHLPLIPGSVSGFVGNGHDHDPAATVQFGAGGFVGSSGGGQDHEVPAFVHPVAGGVFGSTTGQDHMFPLATQFGAGIFVGSRVTGHTQAPSEAVQPLPGDGPIGLFGGTVVGWHLSESGSRSQ
jgi:hypothetical protein